MKPNWIANKLAFVAVLISSQVIIAQPHKGEIDSLKLPVLRDHYMDEYTLDESTAPARWLEQKAGMHVSFASTTKHYFRAEVPELNESIEWNATGWRGERLNTMILIWSPDTIQQVRIILKDLKNEQGHILPTGSMQLNLVRYVISNYPYDAGNANCYISPNRNGYLMPDRFEEFQRFDLPGKSVRPVWLSVDIPSTIAPGNYQGSIDVQSEHDQTNLKISIRVQKQILPEPKDWTYRLDLWQNPWVIAWYNHVKPWSLEHKAFLRKHLSLYAGAGGKWITTYAIHSPWSDNSYMIEEAMIEWIKRKNGSWSFDYNIFDQYVELAMEAGVNKAITIYTPIPWNNRFRFLDEKSGNYIYENWPPDSEVFKKSWNAFLTSLQQHLGKKGWLEKTYLGINENELDQTLAAIKVIRAHSNKWKITYAGNWHPELNDWLNDYCFLLGKEPAVKVVEARSAKGFTSTYYICCNPPIPNDFVFSPPVEGRWLGWYSAAHHYNGFLRWAYDAWPSDPQRDARHVLWPAGDSFLVYPGGNSCIRFEKLREGIADYEKIRILKEKAASSTDKRVKALISSLDNQLNSVLNDREYNPENMKNELDNGNNIIAELSALLNP